MTESSGIFGFRRVGLAGVGVEGGVTLVGPTFVERVVVEASLAAGGVPHPYVLTVSGVSWSAGAFGPRADGLSSHYVEVTASSNLQAIGLTSDIVRHTANTLTTVDNWSALLRGGEKIVIRPHKTLAGVFGGANESGLGAGEPTTADIISVLVEGTSGSFTSYYYRSGSSLGGTGWRSSADPFTDRSGMPLRTGHGLMVKRRGNESMELVLSGYVKTGLIRRPLPTGYALVDALAPVTDQRASAPLAGPAFTLGGVEGSGVIPSRLGGTLSSGTPQTADLVSMAGTVASFYLAAPSGLSAGGWRLTSNPIVDQKNTIIPPAAAMLIQNRGSAKQWSRPQPFTSTTP
ncbi:MAG: hypothetical protein ACKV19_18830 [Verrucomicrobiales bacterium]